METQIIPFIVQNEASKIKHYTIEDFLYNAASGKFIRLYDGADVAKSAIDKGIPETNWPIDEYGEPMKPSTFMYRKSNPYRVSGATYIPGKPKIIENLGTRDGHVVTAKGDSIYNYYDPPAPINPKWRGDISLWMKLLDAVSDADREDILDRFAYSIQNPGAKINGVYVLAGPQGHGKDSLFAPLWMYLERLMQVTDITQISSRYTSWVKCNILLINETTSSHADSKKVYDALKPASVNQPEWLRYENKYSRSMQVANVVTIYMTTNHATSLYFEPDDRRFTLIQFEHAEKPSPEWFYEYHHWLENGGAQAVIHYLSTRDVSHFNPFANARMTPMKERVLEIIRQGSRTGFDDILDEFISKNKRPMVIANFQIEKYIDSITHEKVAADRLKAKFRNTPGFANQAMERMGYSPTTPFSYGKGRTTIRGIYYDHKQCDDNFEHRDQIIDALNQLADEHFSGKCGK
jgi:hypothetical protein